MHKQENYKKLCLNINQLNWIGTSLNNNNSFLFESNEKINLLNEINIENHTVFDDAKSNLFIFCEESNENKINHTQLHLKSIIIKYIYPIIIIFGLLGNMMSFVMMVRVNKRKKNLYRFSFNLAILSLADLAVLVFGCFREYSEEILDWRLRSMNLFLCKFIYFNCYLFSSFSSYIHAFISVERWYAISYPIKFKIHQFKNKRFTFITFILCFSISSPYLALAELKKTVALNHILYECEAIQNHFLSNLILAVFDSIFFFNIPFLVAFIFSSLTLIRLYKNNQTRTEVIRIYSLRRNHHLEGVHQNNNINFNVNSNNISHVNSIVKYYFNKRSNNNNHQNNDSLQLSLCESLEQISCNSYYRTFYHKSNNIVFNNKSSSNFKLTIMLMSLPISYIITNFPIFFTIILQFFPKNDYDLNENQIELSIAKVLMYINNSINILFYIFLGQNFRKQFKELGFRKKYPKHQL